MSKIVKVLPTGIVARVMDTLAFKEFVQDLDSVTEAQQHEACYLRSVRGGYVYVTGKLASRCSQFMATIASQAAGCGYDFGTAVREGGFMLWDNAVANAPNRHFYFQYKQYPPVELSVSAAITKPAA